MKTLVDAQLPRRLAHKMNEAGWDARHTLDLPDRNRTPDTEIARIADEERRIVVTKDADFVASHLVQGTPARLLLMSTGNLSNRDLEALVVPKLNEIGEAFESSRFVEISATLLIVHG